VICPYAKHKKNCEITGIVFLTGSEIRVFLKKVKRSKFRDQNNWNMSTVELKKRLIDTIQKTENKNLLEEAFRLLELEAEDIEVYKLSDDQKSVVNEARLQFKSGKFLTNDQADNEIDEWLNK
jgi:hypothetical protein